MFVVVVVGFCCFVVVVGFWFACLFVFFIYSSVMKCEGTYIAQVYNGNIHIVLFCSGSQEDLMENYCHTIVILFMLKTCCCLYRKFIFVKYAEGEKRTEISFTENCYE